MHPVWKKFPNLTGVLIGKQGLPLKLSGKVYVYICYVKSVLLYCSEAWELTLADEMKLGSAEHWIRNMLFGVQLADRASSAELDHRRVCMDMAVQDVIVRNYLLWYGHVMRLVIQNS